MAKKKTHGRTDGQEREAKNNKDENLTLLGLPQALDESHGLTLKAAGHPAPRAGVHELHELLRHEEAQSTTNRSS